MFDLTGKTALVTGSTQGIGLAIAKTLAEQGAKVFIHGATSMEKCLRACEQVKNATPVVANLLCDADLDKLYEATGDVDILVLNASVQYKRAWNEFSDEEYENQMNCNVKSTYKLICKYAPAMRANKWGRIVTLGSVNQYNQHPELSLYGVTKAAQYKMVRNFAPIFAPDGVTINNVAPGAISTPRNAAVTDDPALKASVEAKIPAGRFGTSEEISPAVLLLCSNEGAYITGTEIVIDGGLALK